MPLLSVQFSIIKINLVSEVSVVISPIAYYKRGVKYKPILVGYNAFQITKVLTVS